jgi:uncharacterized protein (TIGR00369 family)
MDFQPRFPGYEAKLRASFARQTIMRTFGAEMVEVAPGRAVLAAPIGPGVLQQHGFAHAGLTFTLGDSAAGYAALSLLSEPEEVLTAEMKINLLAPAAGEGLVAEGSVVRAGRRLIVVQARVFAEGGGARREVALLQGTMLPAAP